MPLLKYMPIIAVLNNDYNHLSFFILRLLTFIFAFFIVIAGAYYTTKFISKSSIHFTQYKNIKIIEKASLGMDKSVCLIQIGEYYYLIACGKHNIEFIDKFEQRHLNVNENHFEKQMNFHNFSTYLNKYFHKKDSELSSRLRLKRFFDVHLSKKLNTIKRQKEEINFKTDKEEYK